MRTINNILEYNLTETEISYLFISGIINGCGAKGGTNFDVIIETSIRAIPEFDEDKATSLFMDIRKICYEHDIDFRFKKGFYKSNYMFAKKVYRLLREANVEWVTRKQAYGVSVGAFCLLNKFGKEAYTLTK